MDYAIVSTRLVWASTKKKMSNREKTLAILNDKAIDFEILEHSKAVYTCAETALERKVSLDQVTKTLLCYDKHKNVLAFLIPGSCGLNQKKARKVVGSNKLRFIPKEIVTEEYGLIIGAISPLLMLGKARFFMDEKLTQHEFLTMSSGEAGSGVKLKMVDLKAVVDVEVCDITD